MHDNYTSQAGEINHLLDVLDIATSIFAKSNCAFRAEVTSAFPDAWTALSRAEQIKAEFSEADAAWLSQFIENDDD